MFKRILIANRGEIALRVIRACKALGVETVAVYSEADAQSPHLEEADRTVCVGPGPAGSSYLNQEALLQAALQYDCQALHPGYGFLSENARFAARCEQQKTTFIGPSPNAMRLMGDKATGRATMERLGIGGVPGSEELVLTEEQALAEAERVGYPVLLKATAGGGGKGMRLCRTPDELPQAFQTARMEAEKAFSNPALYLERFVEGGRHIEFQILGDRYGKVIHLGERECSTQRNNQKLIEEAPSPGVPIAQREELGARICAALSQLGYVGAGTIELLRTPRGELFFMEMNTRLQVEHPVTEMVTGADLVQWQLRIAAGEPLTLDQDAIQLTGHAIECRLNAEDPTQGFRPCPGTLTTFEAPEAWRYNHAGPVRLDSHVRSGYAIPTYYDSMIGKLIVHADTRSAAIAQMREALLGLELSGPTTTRDICVAIMDDPQFASGDYDTPRMAAMMRRYADQHKEG
ncbi:MAG: acetyl-CoA carboxylase biotin carboxylase subunit [Myxococcales bacterium]|nr:acetyl-CoA carboxylase biotin carboxylase subunit [Myxococcales bacterium]